MRAFCLFVYFHVYVQQVAHRKTAIFKKKNKKKESAANFTSTPSVDALFIYMYVTLIEVVHVPLHFLWDI